MTDKPREAAQQAPLRDGLTTESDRDLQQFFRTTNLAAISKRVAVATAWRVSHQQTKKRIKQMQVSNAFPDDAQNLTLLNVHSKSFLLDLAAHAREASDGVVSDWAQDFVALATAAESIARRIERTEVRND